MWGFLSLSQKDLEEANDHVSRIVCPGEGEYRHLEPFTITIRLTYVMTTDRHNCQPPTSPSSATWHGLDWSTVSICIHGMCDYVITFFNGQQNFPIYGIWEMCTFSDIYLTQWLSSSLFDGRLQQWQSRWWNEVNHGLPCTASRTHSHGHLFPEGSSERTAGVLCLSHVQFLCVVDISTNMNCKYHEEKNFCVVMW